MLANGTETQAANGQVLRQAPPNLGVGTSPK